MGGGCDTFMTEAEGDVHIKMEAVTVKFNPCKTNRVNVKTCQIKLINSNAIFLR